MDPSAGLDFFWRGVSLDFSSLDDFISNSLATQPCCVDAGGLDFSRTVQTISNGLSQFLGLVGFVQECQAFADDPSLFQ